MWRSKNLLAVKLFLRFAIFILPAKTPDFSSPLPLEANTECYFFNVACLLFFPSCQLKTMRKEFEQNFVRTSEEG